MTIEVAYYFKIAKLHTSRLSAVMRELIFSYMSSACVKNMNTGTY